MNAVRSYSESYVYSVVDHKGNFVTPGNSLHFPRDCVELTGLHIFFAYLHHGNPSGDCGLNRPGNGSVFCEKPVCTKIQKQVFFI